MMCTRYGLCLLFDWPDLRIVIYAFMNYLFIVVVVVAIRTRNLIFFLFGGGGVLDWTEIIKRVCYIVRLLTSGPCRLLIPVGVGGPFQGSSGQLCQQPYSAVCRVCVYVLPTLISNAFGLARAQTAGGTPTFKNLLINISARLRQIRDRRNSWALVSLGIEESSNRCGINEKRFYPIFECKENEGEDEDSM